MLFNKIRVHHNHPKSRIFIIFAFMTGFGFAMIATVLPNYIHDILNSDELVGYFFTRRSIVVVLANLLVGFIFIRISSVRFFYISLLILITSSICLYFTDSSILIMVQDTIRETSTVFLTMGISLMIFDFVAKNKLHKVEGARFTLSNIGWLLGPLAAGFIATYFGYDIIFLISGAIFIFMLMFFFAPAFICKKSSFKTSRKIWSRRAFGKYGVVFPE